jgi:NDP-sugar pyrophosphorylase family protein
MTKPQLIIPMSGLGKRFIEAGYAIPKPLIPILGEPMIAHILRMYKGWDDIIFIVNKDHLENSELQLEETLLNMKPQAKIVAIERHKLGPSYAVIQAKEFLAKDKPVVVNYCDFAGEFDLDEYEKELWNKDATLLTYTGFHPHMLGSTKYAYIQKNEHDEVVAIQEKESFTASPMSEEASAGSYGFGNGKILIDAIENQILSQDSFNGEFYTSLTLKPILKAKGKISSVIMKSFFQWGTPEDLTDFLYWIDSIKNIDATDDNLPGEYEQSRVILAAGRGERVASQSLVPKPALPILQSQLWQYSARSSQRNTESVLVVRKETFPFLNNTQEVDPLLLDSVTKGQADSARIGLEALKKSENTYINILATDNVLPENFSDWAIKLAEEKNFDVVIWTAKDYPLSRLTPFHFSWVKTESSNVIDALYKSPPPINETEWAVITGNFSFRNLQVATHLINAVLSNSKHLINKEYYLDSIISIALNNSLRIGAIEIPHYFSLGTMEELQTFIYWDNIFRGSFFQKDYN